VVDWVSGVDPFTDMGDSGALVYGLEKSAIVPMGVHIGRPQYREKSSLFLSLESYVVEGEKLGLNLYFS
jgi:hypothetical protein